MALSSLVTVLDFMAMANNEAFSRSPEEVAWAADIARSVVIVMASIVIAAVIITAVTPTEICGLCQVQP